MRRGDYRNYGKRHIDKIKAEGGGWGRLGFQLGCVVGWGEKAHNSN